jgi:hypothetical protein
MPPIRMRIDILGGFHGNSTGVRRGEVVDVDPYNAERYVRSGWADYVSAVAPPPVERAVAPQHETAKLEIPPEVEALAKPKPKPLDEPEPEPEEPDDDPPAAQVKRRTAPGRRAGR